MENSFQTSFIPKKPINSVDTVIEKPKSIFTILSVILLIITIITSVGFFAYKSYLIKQKKSLSVSLLKIRESFDQNTISKLELFDRRITTAKSILDKHIVLSPTFELLGSLTIPSIQYTSFKYYTNNKGFYVKLSGISRDYKSIALQADVFNSNKGRYFKDVIFSNLTKNRKNYVTFNINFMIDPILLSYQNNILLKQAQVGPLNSSNN